MTEPKTLRPSGSALNPARRTTVRLALATGATVVTLMGAQTLFVLERPANAQTSVSNAVASQPGNAAPRLSVVINQNVDAAKNAAVGKKLSSNAALKIVRNKPSTGAPSSSTGNSASSAAAFAPPVPVLDQQTQVIVQNVPAGGGAPSNNGGGGGHASSPAPAQPAPATKSSH